ncbi:MAG: PhzF family phenazine biosynthesis protein [Jatrophihabitans sp.]|uniref:PhzF family phenazine biosynthesis protein n=1 Tax=Jatrophihabitans sp. TaxID=1932789 RepID=UPI00390E5C52
MIGLDGEVVWTTVFADSPGGGNPCPVVFGAEGATTAELQARAAEFGAETAFVLPPEAGGDVRLRYFVPLHEMEMCVHATVASAVLLGQSGRLPRSPAAVETPLGVLDVAWDADAGEATVAQFAPQFGEPVDEDGRDRVLSALGAPRSSVAAGVGPIQAVSTARPKLMIALADEAALDDLTPDFEQLWAACDEFDVTGFYPFTLDAAGADAAARQFPRRAGYVEDPATGVAACALGAYLARHGGGPDGWHRWQIAQGRTLGRPSLIVVEALVEHGAVVATRVGGRMQRSGPPTHRL